MTFQISYTLDSVLSSSRISIPRLVNSRELIGLFTPGTVTSLETHFDIKFISSRDVKTAEQ